MLMKKHRLVVAAVLAGAVLGSPLLCGMTCVETPVDGASAAVESAPRAEELAAEFVGGALVRCVLSHLVSKIDFSEWADQVDVVTWVWVGVEVWRVSDEAWPGEVLWR
jgi:hypothetical protein